MEQGETATEGLLIGSLQIHPRQQQNSSTGDAGQRQRPRHQQQCLIGMVVQSDECLGLDLEQSKSIRRAALGEETASIRQLQATGLMDAASPHRCHGLDHGACQRPPLGDQALQQLLVHPRPKPMLASMDRIASAP